MPAPVKKYTACAVCLRTNWFALHYFTQKITSRHNFLPCFNAMALVCEESGQDSFKIFLVSSVLQYASPQCDIRVSLLFCA